jgi:hypothetical protein
MLAASFVVGERQHVTLPGGMTDRLWEIVDIVSALEAWEATNLN